MPDRRRGRAGLTYIEARDLALRQASGLARGRRADLTTGSTSLPSCLPLMQKGRLAQANAEADRYAGTEAGLSQTVQAA